MSVKTYEHTHMADDTWTKMKQGFSEGFEPVASRGEARKREEMIQRHDLRQGPKPTPALSPSELARRQAEISAKYAAIEQERLQRQAAMPQPPTPEQQGYARRPLKKFGP